MTATPGPWTLRKAPYWGHNMIYLDPPTGRAVAVVLSDANRSPAETEANANLFLAAPAMLAALKAALRDGLTDSVYAQARAAIAMATAAQP